MKVKLYYSGNTVEVNIDIGIKNVEILSDQLAKIDFVIRLPYRALHNDLRLIHGQKSYKPKLIKFHDIEFDLNLIADLFNDPIVSRQIEANVENGTTNIIGNVLGGFELQEYRNQDMKITVDDKASAITMEKELKIQKGNRFHSTRNNIPLVNFVHYCLKDFLGDNKYELTALPEQFDTNYSDPSATMFQAAFLNTLRASCESRGIKMVVGSCYQFELEEAIGKMMGSFSKLLGKPMIITKTPEIEVKACAENSKEEIVTRDNIAKEQRILLEAMQASFSRLLGNQPVATVEAKVMPREDGDALSAKSLAESVARKGVAETRSFERIDAVDARDEDSNSPDATLNRL